jgi:hypothetical protein
VGGKDALHTVRAEQLHRQVRRRPKAAPRVHLLVGDVRYHGAATQRRMEDVTVAAAAGAESFRFFIAGRPWCDACDGDRFCRIAPARDHDAAHRTARRRAGEDPWWRENEDVCES